VADSEWADKGSAHEEEREGDSDSARADSALAQPAPVIEENTEESSAIAEGLHRSDSLLAAYSQAIDVLQLHGAVTAAHHLQLEEKKELRRRRLAAAENPAVAGQLAEIRAARAADDRRARLAVQDANRKQRARDLAVSEAAKAKEKLLQRKRELLSVEGVLEARHTLKRFSPEGLGKGKNSGGVAARRLRFEVLDRVALLGSGLSAAQRNDWAWWKETWDAKMCEEHGLEWGQVFCEWIQRILNDFNDGVSNAFSILMHNETQRKFADVEMLAVPGSSGCQKC